MANAFKNLHDVTLQRLNVYHKNNGHRVYYDAQHFASTVNAWNGVPVIFAETQAAVGAEHPDFADVTAGTLPSKYHLVGSISNARLAETGEPVLKAAITFTDSLIEAKANAGRLTLSTGLASAEAKDEKIPGATRIAGPVTPNHVLVFERGACPNCFPNDAGAMFHNTPDAVEVVDDDRTAFLNLARDLEQRHGIKITGDDGDDDPLLHNPGVQDALRGAALRIVQGANGQNVPPPTTEVERLADRYIADKVIRATGPEIRAKEEVEAVSARIAERFGVRFV